MKRLTIFAAFALAAVLPMASALAAPSDAADFAADCNADGRIDVTGTDRYVGGAGALVGDCSVVLDPGAILVLRGLELTGSGISRRNQQSRGNDDPGHRQHIPPRCCRLPRS